MTGALVLGTAGHVDHGKTSLVHALTGRDTDRLPEEKARGISIALGFAPLDLGTEVAVSLVDVPGHERFVRHMVAGASGIDGYLMCIAADDGVMPQTREHFAVLDLLGVRNGVVAITKSDLVDPALVADEARELVGPRAMIIPVSVRDGSGLAELRAALVTLVTGLERRTTGARPRLFVDRSFAVAGAGTVVTGTLWGAGINVGDRVAILPGRSVVRVRGAQTHDRPTDRADGGRVALNLVGVAREDVPRGVCIVRADDEWRTTELLDVRVDLLIGSPELATRRRVQVFLGTAELSATLVALEGKAISSGQSAYAQLRLDREVPAIPGDRLVLRVADAGTVGGATVIDATPRRHGRGTGVVQRLAVLEVGDPAEILRLRVEDSGQVGLPADQAEAAIGPLVGVRRLPGGHLIAETVATVAEEYALAAVQAGTHSLAAVSAATGLGAEAADGVVAAMALDGAIVVSGASVALPGPAPEGDREHQLAGLLREAGRQPPGLRALAETVGCSDADARAALTQLVTTGKVVTAGDLWFDADVARTASEEALVALASGPMTVASLRDLWGTGRRHALALAQYLDAARITRRDGDLRMLRRHT